MFFWISHRFWVKCLCWLICYVSQLLSHLSILCFVCLELGLCQLCFFIASWLLVMLSRRGRGLERLSFFPFACNSHGLFPQWLQLGPVFSYYWHHKRRSWYFTGISIRQAVTPPQKSKTPLFSTHHLSFYVLILLTTSLYFPSLRDSTCFLGYLHLSFFLI